MAGRAANRFPSVPATGPPPGQRFDLRSPVVEDTEIWSAATVGVIAAAIAIVAGVVGLFRWFRAQWQRRRTLRDLLDEVETQNRTLVTTAVELSRTMIEGGITWTGWRIPPPELEPRFKTLASIDRALERLHARVRGLRAEPGVERLRADIELAVTILRRGVNLYTEGTWATYREAIRDDYPRTFTPADPDTRKQRYFMGAGGQDPAPVLHDESAVEEVHHLTRDLELAVRSAWHQIGDEPRATAFESDWPRRSYDIPVGSAA